MNKIRSSLVLSTLILGGTDALAAGPSPHARFDRVQAVAVFGDSPYGTSPTDTAEFSSMPAFIDAINADRDISLALHVGDIHSGSQYCTEAYNRSVYNLWTRFQVPLVYTPGDNEWADCHKSKEGGGTYNAATGLIDYKRDANGNLINYMGGDPVANLDLVRSIFFVNPGYSLGAHRHLHTQASAFKRSHPTDAKYVENLRWEQDDIQFVTVNIPGGSNNDSDPWYGTPVETERQHQERTERTGAVLRWLDDAFERAHEERSKAIVIQTQADMWDPDGKSASHLSLYRPIVERIAMLTKAFGRPVLLLNGDSHRYRSDNPLAAGAVCSIEASATTQVACSDNAFKNQPIGYNVPNFHRITVHGSTVPLEWLKLRIDSHNAATSSEDAFGPFSWKRMIVR